MCQFCVSKIYELEDQALLKFLHPLNMMYIIPGTNMMYIIPETNMMYIIPVHKMNQQT